MSESSNTSTSPNTSGFHEGESTLYQFTPVLSTPTRALRRFTQAMNGKKGTLGHRGQEDYGVRVDFEANYKCSVQYTGEDNVGPAESVVHAPEEPDIERLLAEAQRDDSRLNRDNSRRSPRRNPGTIKEDTDFTAQEAGWEEVYTPGDMHEVNDDPEVYALDSSLEASTDEGHWSFLGKRPEHTEHEREPEVHFISIRRRR